MRCAADSGLAKEDPSRRQGQHLKWVPQGLATGPASLPLATSPTTTNPAPLLLPLQTGTKSKSRLMDSHACMHLHLLTVSSDECSKDSAYQNWCVTPRVMLPAMFAVLGILKHVSCEALPDETLNLC